MSQGDRSYGTRGPSPPVRLPRLEMMDRSHQRERSTSSPGLPRDRPIGIAGHTLWSSAGQEPMLPLSRSHSSTTSPTAVPSRWRKDVTSPSSIPRLPEPSRPSSMMTGSLPPLPSLHGDTMSSSDSGESSRFSISAASRPPPLHRASVSHRPHPYEASASTSSAMTVSRHSPYEATVRRASVPTATGLPASAVPTVTNADAAQASRKSAKAHVSSACLNCKRAHLACDSERPCRRCAKLGKTATCVDVQHKKRGRPRLKDREAEEATSLELAQSVAPVWGPMDHSPSMVYYPAQGLTDRPPPLAESSALPYAHRIRSDPELSTAGPSELHLAMQRPSAAIRKSALVTSLLCGLDFVTVHASQESQALFGLLPSQVARREVLDFVHPGDVNSFEDAWSRLVHPVGLAPCPFPSEGFEMMHRQSCPLLSPARGTIFVEEVVRLHAAGNVWTPCHVRLHLGGAFGLDLYRPETRDRAFVVCSLQPVEAGLPPAHPNHHDLGTTAFDPLGWPGTIFKTPVDRGIPPALPPLSTAPRPSSNHSYTEPADSQSPSQRWSAGDRFVISPKIRGREQDEAASSDGIRPSKAVRLSSYLPSPADSIPASAVASVDTSMTKSAASPSSVESLAPKSPSATSATSMGSGEPPNRASLPDRFAKYPFSTWPSQQSSSFSRPVWQPTFSSARSATASKLSSQAEEQASKPILHRSTSSDSRNVRSSVSMASDVFGAVAT